MYEHVAHRASFSGIAEKITDCFGLPVFTPDVRTFKLLLSRYYEETYKQLLEKIVGGTIIHADETEVHLRADGQRVCVGLHKPGRGGVHVQAIARGKFSG